MEQQLLALGQQILYLSQEHSNILQATIKSFDALIFVLESTKGPIESFMSEKDTKFIHMVYQHIAKFDKASGQSKLAF